MGFETKTKVLNGLTVFLAGLALVLFLTACGSPTRHDPIFGPVVDHLKEQRQ